MAKATVTLTGSSETMTTGGTSNNYKRRGKKRRQNFSCESGSDDSGTISKGVIEKKPSSRPGTPEAAGETPADDVARTNPEAGWPGSSSQRKVENEPDNRLKASPSPGKESKFPSRPLALNEPPNVKSRGKDACKCGQCKIRPDRSSGILRKARVGYDVAVRGKGKEISKKYDTSDASMSGANSERGRKRAKRVLTESARDESVDSLLLKVLEVSSKVKGLNDLKPSSKQTSKLSTKLSSKQSSKLKTPDTISIDSRSSYSGKSSGKSSGRSSVRSMESMDGQTELLESLVHAAHAEDKLSREKQELQKKLQTLKSKNDELEQELLYALKVADELRTKYKSASKDRHEMKHNLRIEKAKWEREFRSALKGDHISLANNVRDKAPSAHKGECSICFEEMDNSSSKNKGKKSGGKQLKQPARFRPCNHGGACIDCAISVWQKTNQCPFCGTKLSGQPTTIH